MQHEPTTRRDERPVRELSLSCAMRGAHKLRLREPIYSRPGPSRHWPRSLGCHRHRGALPVINMSAQVRFRLRKLDGECSELGSARRDPSRPPLAARPVLPRRTHNIHRRPSRTPCIGQCDSSVTMTASSGPSRLASLQPPPPPPPPPPPGAPAEC